MSDIRGRLEHWIKAVGEPTRAGRADPDNEMIYLMRDAMARIAELEARLSKGGQQ